jgi:hypothetical protein
MAVEIGIVVRSANKAKTAADAISLAAAARYADGPAVVRAWGVWISMFFFEKKNQKTFIIWREPNYKSLFASFSSEKEAS